MKASKKQWGKYFVYQLTDEQGLTIEILPAFGGMMRSIQINKEGELLELLDAYATDEEVEKGISRDFRAAKLFPFPNRIEDGKYSFEGNDYLFECNFPQENNAIHGLVYQSNFDVVEFGEAADSAFIVMQYAYKKEVEAYPFELMIQVKYELTDKGLECETQVINTGNKTAPIADGWHPQFNLHGKVDDLILTLPSKTRFIVNKRMLPTGEEAYTRFIDPKSIGEQTFDDCFLLEQQNEEACYSLENKEKNIKLSFTQDAAEGQYIYVQLYTPLSRKVISIEPVTIAANAFNHKKNLVSLVAKASWKAAYRLKIEY